MPPPPPRCSQEHPRTAGQSPADLTHSYTHPNQLRGRFFTTTSSIPPLKSSLGKCHHPGAQGGLARVWPEACSGDSPLGVTSHCPLCSAMTCSHQSSFALICQNIISGEEQKDTPLLLVLLPVPELSASPAAVNVPYSLVKLHAQEMKVYRRC